MYYSYIEQEGWADSRYREIQPGVVKLKALKTRRWNYNRRCYYKYEYQFYHATRNVNRCFGRTYKLSKLPSQIFRSKGKAERAFLKARTRYLRSLIKSANDERKKLETELQEVNKRLKTRQLQLKEFLANAN